MASYAVDDHGQMVPRACVHDRLSRLQKIVVALEWRNRQCHATNPWAEASCPRVGGVDEPIGLNHTPVRQQRAYAICAQHGAKNLGMLLHMNAQFFCPPEPLV